MKKRGPKLTPIVWEEFDKLCSIHCTLREIAGWFDCSEDTIERAVVRDKGLKFAEYYEQKASNGKVSLRRKMFQMAMDGDRTMLIWLSKQHLGMSEKQDQKHVVVGANDGPVQTEQTVAMKNEIITLLKAKKSV